MDSLPRIIQLEERWARTTEEREALYVEILRYRYSGQRVPSRLESKLEVLDKHALAMAEALDNAWQRMDAEQMTAAAVRR